jgi:23S rRNA (uracil747-C5)-methyltransferase
MLELYCGQGAFSFFAAPFIQKGVGLEINQDAVKSANQTATRLGFSHLSFVSADVTEKAESSKKVQELAKKIEADLILVNPPRRGLGKPGVDLILSERPEHLIYSSCSIDSLSEDLKSLHESYRVIKMQIFDLFPHTAHFEILNHLQRR